MKSFEDKVQLLDCVMTHSHGFRGQGHNLPTTTLKKAATHTQPDSARTNIDLFSKVGPVNHQLKCKETTCSINIFATTSKLYPKQILEKL